MPRKPCPATAVYAWPMSGMHQSTMSPNTAIPISRNAYTRSGCSRRLMTRASARLPTHMPPMKVPSSTPIETAEDPITSWISWNQTIS